MQCVVNTMAAPRTLEDVADSKPQIKVGAITVSIVVTQQVLSWDAV